MMELKTHLKVDRKKSGEVVLLEEGYAKVELTTDETMAVDEEGLVHGGYCFCAADFAAMAAVNHPYVVLAKSESKFIAPVRAGEIVVFEATVEENDGRKQKVKVVGDVEQTTVFEGTFYTAILSSHVLNV